MSLWFKHDAHFHEHPKCLRMRRLAGGKADACEVGWWRLVAAAKRIGGWTFEGEDHLEEAAGRYYRFVSIYREVGLLDDLTIHNAAEYQAPLSGAERVAKHRASNAQPVTPVVTDVTPREEKSREEKNRQTEARDPADIYWQLVGRWPTEKATSWIDGLSEQYGAEPTIEALVKSHIEDPSAQTILGRTRDRLAADARRLDRAEQEAEKQRLREKRAQPRAEQPWLAEYRAMIEKQYGDAA